MRVLFAALLIALSAPALADSAIPTAEIVKGAVDGYIRPQFHTFATDTGVLQSDVAALCATPSAEALAAAQDEFRTTVLQFARIEFVRLGPLQVGDRLERLLFWPDKKGIALKQVQEALVAKDATAASADTLQGKSVAMQGLVALDYLLFGTGAADLGSDTGAYRCSYAAAIATLVDGLATTIDSEWQDNSPDSAVAHMQAPKPDASDYRSEREVLDKLAATLIHGTEAIRDQRIAPILGEATGSPKPKSALFWRSGMTVPTLKANFEGLRDFFVAARFPDAVKNIASWISSGALFEFEGAIKAASDIHDPIDVVVTDPDQFKELRYLAIVTHSLDTLLGENMPGALGLTTGFSLLDGD
jgi:predicted lipoprotein